MPTIHEIPKLPDPPETGFTFSNDEESKVKSIDERLMQFQDPQEASKIMSFADYMEQSKFMREVEMSKSGTIVPAPQTTEEDAAEDVNEVDVQMLLANGGLTERERQRIHYQSKQNADLEMKFLGADLRRIDHSLAEVGRFACDSSPRLSRSQIDELMASARANALPQTLNQARASPSQSPVDSLDSAPVPRIPLDGVSDHRASAKDLLNSARETNRSAWRVMEEVESALRAAEDGLAVQESLEKRNPNLYIFNTFTKRRKFFASNFMLSWMEFK